MKVLFIIASDPRTSHRPAEAIRIAAGVATWKKVEVNVYLQGEATRVLAKDADDLVDEEHLTRYLPMLREGGGKVWAQQSEQELVRLAREHSVVTWF